MITYSDNLNSVSKNSLEGFFVGWKIRPSPAEHLAILSRSSRFWLALDGSKCIGFITAVTDGESFAHIPLLEVLPAYQGQGIGSNLLRHMLKSLEGYYSIDITCDIDVKGFYEKSGFNESLSMIKRNYSHWDKDG